MVFSVEEFTKYCIQILGSNFGNISKEIIDKTIKKQKLDENSKEEDIKNFINIIESNVRVFAGKQKAEDICNIIRKKVKEIGSDNTMSKYGYKSKVTDIGKIIEIGNTIDDKVKEFDNMDNIKEKERIVDISTEILTRDTEDKNNKNELDENNKNELDENNKNELDENILLLFDLRYGIEYILKELNIEEEKLADKIIDLDMRDLIILKDKNWIPTQRGRDLLKRRREELKKLKLDYLYGNITKEEFLEKNKRLDSIKRYKSEKIELEKFNLKKENEQDKMDKIEKKEEEERDKTIEKKEEEERDKTIEKKEEEERDKKNEQYNKAEKLICKKCGTENRLENIFCTKCGEPLQ